MKRRSFLRNGLLVALALVLVASMPLAVSADPVDDRDQDEIEDEFAEPSETTGYAVPDSMLEFNIGADVVRAAKELADVEAYGALEELELDAAEFLEDYEGVDPAEVLDDQDDSDE